MSALAESGAGIERNTRLLDIATCNVIRLGPDDQISEAARIMSERRISSIVVTDRDGRPLGIITERNILQAMQSGCTSDTALQNIMSSPVITVTDSMSCLDAYQICLRDGIRHLVIVDNNQLLRGVVSETDFRLHINLTALAGHRQIASAMSHAVFSLPIDASLLEALNYMHLQRDSCVVVVDAGIPVGIVTERDIVRIYSTQRARESITIGEIMNSPVLTIPQDNTINEAAALMLTGRVRHLAVIDHAGRLTGLLSEHDLTHAMTLGLIGDKLSAEGAFLHTLINTLPDLLWVKNVEGIYLACNPRFEQFFGAQEKDIVGKTDYDFVDQELADFFRERDRVAMIKGEPSVNEERVIFASDGHSELLETLKTPMFDNAGNLIGVLGIGRDVSQRKLNEDKLVDQNAFLDSIFESALDAFVLMDARGIITGWSSQAEKIFGWKKAEVIGRAMHETIAPVRYRETHVRGLKNFLVTGVGPALNTKINLSALHRDGHEFPAELSISAIQTAHGYMFSAFISDITERKRSEEDLRTLASVFDNSLEAIMLTSAENIITDVNPSFTRVTGYRREEVLGKNPKMLRSGRHDQAFYSVMWQSLQQKKSWRGEIWNRRKSGEIYAELLSVSAICNDSGQVQRYVSVFSDISYLKEHEAELSRVANYDALTGIPNRRLFADRMFLSIARAKRSGMMLAVCYIDLDGFKQINDTYGHEAGDHLLVEVTHRIQETLRGIDTLARFGGDEFVALLSEEVSTHECMQVLERILAAVSMPVAFEGGEMSVSASIGVTLYPVDDADGETLLRHADQAMYIAKQAGKNRYHLYDETESSGKSTNQTRKIKKQNH
jgi:diguanylate cyclase (GGDEF)-like protein/PAS domain S-box-containing protein